MRTVRVGGFFSGIGSHISACKRLSDRARFVYVFQCEWDQRTAEASNVLHGDIPNLGDITPAEKDGKRQFPKTALYKFAGNAVCVACFVRITEQILDDMDEPRAPSKSTLDAWGC